MTMIIHGTNKGEAIDGSKLADKLYGEGGNDGLGGHSGADLLDGGTGDDRLHGGKDRDTLIGGAGADTFIFKELGASNSDKIKDFRHGSDHFELHGVFKALQGGDVPANEFYLGTKAHDANDHIIYDKATGNLYYDEDGNGAHKQELFAQLLNHSKLTHDDFSF
jgi:Ca2+-binding RTX toxin-like protein